MSAAAKLVLGQPDFTHGGANIPGCSSSTISYAFGVAVDTTMGRVYVCDAGRNRVLWWDAISELTNGKSPDGVLGQPDLSSTECNRGGAVAADTLNFPRGVSVDAAGNVWVSDSYNRRVLKFSAPSSNGPAAILVLGQPGVSSSGGACSQNGIWEPDGVAVDNSGNVWVADTGSHRILKYINPATNGQAASLVLGQPDFTSSNAMCSQTGLGRPQGVCVDSAGNVWVADSANNRVLKYTTPSLNGQAASLVLGQADFDANQGSCTAAGLLLPDSINSGGADSVWVTDSFGRILKYDHPIINGQSASMVLGKPDFTSSHSACNQNGNGNGMHGISVDEAGNVWVADTWNNRVLKYATPSLNGQSASIVLGQPDFISSGNDTIVSDRLNHPCSVSVDMLSGRVYVCDTYNSRIVWWNDSASLTNGKSADGVIGQPDFSSSGYGCSQTQLSFPYGISVDGSGNIWVADVMNSRVLKFNKPTSNGPSACLVLGQPDFTSNDSACSQTGMDCPYGVSVDGSGNVWVADMYNHRALKYTQPTSNGQGASLVLGQPDFTSHTPANNRTGMSYPRNVRVEGSGSVWVVANESVLKYAHPEINGQAASLALGQPDIGWSPCDVSVDSSGHVWVVDSLNNRVLKYNNPTRDGQPASQVVGQNDFTSSGYSCTQGGLWVPSGVCVDMQDAIWVADSGNSRILRFAPITSSTSTVDNAASVSISLPLKYGDVTLDIPAGAFADKVVIAISEAADLPSSDRPAVKVTTVGIEINNDKHIQPLKAITLTMSYRDSDVAGFDPAKLQIAYFDETNQRWVVIPSKSNVAEKKVVGTVRHLSQFALVQPLPADDLSNVRAFPNPFNPASGRLTIDNLTSSAAIKIYTVAGELVRSVDYTTANGRAFWRGDNDNGSIVASGVYIALIKSPAGTRKLKIAVQK